MERPLTYRIFTSVKQERPMGTRQTWPRQPEETQNFIDLKPLKNWVGKND